MNLNGDEVEATIDAVELLCEDSVGAGAGAGVLAGFTIPKLNLGAVAAEVPGALGTNEGLTLSAVVVFGVIENDDEVLTVGNAGLEKVFAGVEFPELAVVVGLGLNAPEKPDEEPCAAAAVDTAALGVDACPKGMAAGPLLAADANGELVSVAESDFGADCREGIVNGDEDVFDGLFIFAKGNVAGVVDGAGAKAPICVAVVDGVVLLVVVGVAHELPNRFDCIG